MLYQLAINVTPRRTYTHTHTHSQCHTRTYKQTHTLNTVMSMIYCFTLVLYVRFPFSNQDYRKLSQKLSKNRSSLVKKQEKVVKSHRDKISKGKGSKESLKETEEQQEKELIQLDREESTKVSVMESHILVHTRQLTATHTLLSQPHPHTHTHTHSSHSHTHPHMPTHIHTLHSHTYTPLMRHILYTTHTHTHSHIHPTLTYSQLYEKKRELIEAAHRTQLDTLVKKTHKSLVHKQHSDNVS